jgi:hypothetical protein
MGGKNKATGSPLALNILVPALQQKAFVLTEKVKVKH